MNRRRFLSSLVSPAFAGLGVAPMLAMPAIGQSRLKRFNLVLNTSYSGPQAWLLLAQDKGYLAAEGIELVFTQGSGAYTAAPRMASSGFDFGYGDINSLIEVAASTPDKAPVGAPRSRMQDDPRPCQRCGPKDISRLLQDNRH